MGVRRVHVSELRGGPGVRALRWIEAHRRADGRHQRPGVAGRAYFCRIYSRVGVPGGPGSVGYEELRLLADVHGRVHRRRHCAGARRGGSARDGLCYEVHDAHAVNPDDPGECHAAAPGALRGLPALDRQV